MRLAVMMLLSLTLCRCFASNAVVRSQAMSFDDVIEDTTDKLLVLNILRAQDKAPPHFDEIPSIHESVTGTASVQGTWPFGPTNKSTARNTLTAGMGVQLAPSFEIDNLATKDSIAGMATPIDPKFVKYWLDRGLDRRVVLMLFFSAIDVSMPEPGSTGTVRRTLRIRNSPRDAIEALYTLPTTGSRGQHLSWPIGFSALPETDQSADHLHRAVGLDAQALRFRVDGRRGLGQGHRGGIGTRFRQDLRHVR